MRNFFSQIADFWKKLTLKQQLSLIVLTLLTLISLFMVVRWANKPQMEVLFSNLDPGDASTIIDGIKEQGIPYEITAGGKTILVPGERVYDLRIHFASKGIPSSGNVGYEIFDENKLGVSDFVQKINYRRALEGELQKTIQQMREISAARVHLVLPEERLFKEDQAEPTASVVIQLKSGSNLASQQIQAIAYLISSSVENLSPDRVTIIDTYGNVLSSGIKGDLAAIKSSNQLELKQNMEKYYRDKVQLMLDRALGVGKSVVQVAIDINFKQIEREQELYDPESQVIRSEQRTKTVSSTQDSTSSKYVSSTNENSSTDYEINRTVERIVDAGGDIGKIQASVLVDGKYEKTTLDDGTIQEQYVPRSKAEIAQIQKAVENAIGYDAYRGDIVTVSQIQFATLEPLNVNPPFFEKYLSSPYVKNVFVLIIAAFVFFLARRTMKKTGGTLKSLIEQVNTGHQGLLEPAAEDSGLLPAHDAKSVAETQKKTAIQNQIKQYVVKRPVDATNLLRTWLSEE